MRDFIRRTAHRLGLLFGPGTGTHRAGDRRPARPAAPRAGEPVRLPLHRSPYGLHLPLDGAESRLVRPYLVAGEQERARQRRRRGALTLAADFGADFGADLDRHVVGTERAAA